ncbi:IgGFc-binding protein [Pseudenhygromyxa sp. WMMC2535]|uniref:IgGFc-binding protein n=1 Tax=Pseudenhygromyxa sp. WMMC2535 TaxID=2712867 RepID=UPI001552E9D9|nr:IgGFc-binding protein [Pseudenhygromyxa sp. WMMC2535]NVB39460.1 IgGFc-binding protein [Pseudenhygromyxa sp. WMMC2535]
MTYFERSPAAVPIPGPNREPLASLLYSGALSLAAISMLACQPPPGSDDEAEAESSEEGTPSGDSESTDDGPTIICVPEETRCTDDASVIETCAATGLEWEASACGTYQSCNTCFEEGEDGSCVAACVGPCEALQDTASSEGCSFYATSMYQADSQLDELPDDAMVVGNPQLELPATVELRFAPEGSNIEELVEGPITLQPGESHVFKLPGELTEYYEVTSMYRSGAVHHVVSDLPVVAYLHSPFEGSSTNGSSLLLPEHMLTGEYVVFGEKAYVVPSYFVAIALEDQTTLRWWPSVDTAGDNLPLPFVAGGEMGEQLLNRFDNVRIDTSLENGAPSCAQDLSGTVVTADKPIWLVSAIRGLRVPFCSGSAIEGCSPPLDVDTACNRGSDFVQEQVLPLDYWGMEYVGPHSPLRGQERHFWRIYAGADDITVSVDPPQEGTPIALAKRGDWAELVVDNATNLYFSADGPFMPVQYVAGHYEADNRGSPAMVQMVPTAQFLDRYVFVTGYNYDEHYVQVIREAGGPDVVLDDVVIADAFAVIGDWEVANVAVEEGPHEIHSEGSFGIIQYGYSDFNGYEDPSSGYGYPGGMKGEVIYIP